MSGALTHYSDWRTQYTFPFSIGVVGEREYLCQKKKICTIKMFHKEVFILYGEKMSREEENSRTPNPSVCTKLRRRTVTKLQ